MPTAGIQLDAGCNQAFEDIRQGKKNKYCIYKIEDKGEAKVTVEYQAPASTTQTEDDEKECYAEFMQRLIDLNEPRFCVYDFRHTSDDGQVVNKCTFVYWSPDSAPGKLKMIYASTQDSCKKAFQGLSKYHQCNDAEELSYESVYGATFKKIT